MTMEVDGLIHEGKPVLVDFSADWCSTCQTMEPIVDEIKAVVGDGINFLTIDIDRTPQVIAGFKIRSIPTFIFFKDGKMIWRRSGLISRRELLGLIRQHKA